MRLVSWNVAGRVERLPAQVTALLEREPDVVGLQEVTATTIPLWRAVLEGRGYRVVDRSISSKIGGCSWAVGGTVS